MFTENLDILFDTNGHAIDATLKIGMTQTSVKVIFDSPTQGVDFYDTQIEDEHFYLTIKQSDLGAAKKGNQFIINGTTYAIALIRHDGTGVSTVFLK